MFITIFSAKSIIAMTVLILIIVLGFKRVPKNQVFIVERLGVYSTTWKPGIHFLLFGAEKVKAKVPTDLQTIELKLIVGDDRKYEYQLTISFLIKNYVNYAYRNQFLYEDLNKTLIEKIEEVNDNVIKTEMTLKALSEYICSELNKTDEFMDLDIKKIDVLDHKIL